MAISSAVEALPVGLVLSSFAAALASIRVSTLAPVLAAFLALVLVPVLLGLVVGAPRPLAAVAASVVATLAVVGLGRTGILFAELVANDSA